MVAASCAFMGSGRPVIAAGDAKLPPVTVLPVKVIDAGRPNVGAPLTPSPLVTAISALVPVIARCVQVSVAVRTAIPVAARPSSAARSLASAKVGLPATPPLLEIARPDAGCVSVRCAQVSVAVRAAKPVALKPSSADRSLASANVGLPATPSAFVIASPAAGWLSVRCAQASAPVRAAMPVEARLSSAARSLARTKPGLPATPSALVIVKPDDGALRLRGA